MASIIQIGDSWRVQIRRKGHKPITKTFARKAAAERFAREVEGKIDHGGSLPGALTTFGELVKAYEDARLKSGREILDTSNDWYVIDRLKAEFGDRPVGQIGTKDLVEFCQRRRAEGAGPYTINLDISKMGTLLRHGASLLQISVPDIVGSARPTLSVMGLIGGGGRRQRRPQGDEMECIIEWLEKNKPKSKIRFRDYITFAATLGLRRAEMCRVLWADLDEQRRTLMIRDRKHPRQKVGNDQVIPLPGDTLEIVLRQPRGDDRIWPYGKQTVSKYFTEACQALGIPDLHLHDLRREAASTLSAAGWSDREVQAVTGHRNASQLDTYIAFEPEVLAKKPIKPKTKKKAVKPPLPG